jgi:diguanylate cyclase (GGDEF)-like protein
LKGTDIPIGARILSVVDCFDALTSDRPYRPRLSIEESLRILIERRGSMYDPLVVDTFVRVHAEIAPEIAPTQLPRQALNEITSSTQNAAGTAGLPRLEEIAASADEMLTLYELARALAGQATISDTGDVIVKHLRRLIPFAQSVLFLYDSAADELEARHATGDVSSVIKGLRIPLGQRLSGWVAANRQTIVNSDPTLDLGDAARTRTPRLRSSLSTPLTCNEQLIGVLTLYSEGPDAFNDDHRRVIEAVARQIGHTFKCAAESDVTARRDSLAGLPSLQQLEQLLQSTGGDTLSVGSDLALLFIEVMTLKQNSLEPGRTLGDEVLHHVVQQSRANLRVADMLFRYRSGELVALLNNTDRHTAKAIGHRIQQSVLEHALSLSTGELVTVEAEVTCVSVPHDGYSFRELVAAAHRQVTSQDSTPSSQVH